ncbi:MAG: hypothetical protein JO103_00565 [Candidatus Eremiobacteraeota bacterium]|nr:hypothetical protein [Candidatus Eremiobacteraeota bacterium]
MSTPTATHAPSPTPAPVTPHAPGRPPGGGPGIPHESGFVSLLDAVLRVIVLVV